MSHPHENFNLPDPEIGTDCLLPHCAVLTYTVRLSRPVSAESSITRRI